MRWLPITPKDNIPDSTIPVIHTQCLTAVNQSYFPLFDLHRKTVRTDTEIRHIIPDELHLFEQKDKIEYIGTFQHKLKPPNMNNISFIKYKWNEKLIVQSTEFLVQSTKDFSFE